MLRKERVDVLEMSKIGPALTEFQPIAPFIVEFGMPFFFASAASPRPEHGMLWMGLGYGRVGSIGAKESSACRPLGELEIPSKPLAGMLGKVVGAVIFLLL